MLEVRNLVKVYKPKKGKPVKALNGVSIKFPEKGLVFILGKSGCGKSTLLNMMGGLDRVDSGEIIIKGKSSKDFTQADFDSYRNTYLGFIFQEYNILNEFTVGANVALAIELQGRKASKEAINDILEQVDLSEYANRKPTQLSGGQKQRVAIARALVKNPEIILADEPTGALDSKTGIQVFDTLKELSKTKLVIVVSHDREFAESYGDRVIELKDGEVISDIEKYVAESEKKNDSISVIDDKIIQIKKGYELTKEDIQMINEYLQKNDAILSIDSTSNKDLKKFARIDDSGNKECFKETNEEEIVYERKQKFRLIKSRLPFKDSFKIGASGLKAKPVRLVVSILLAFVAFTLFGLADTISAYNKYTATVDSLIDSNVQNISFEKKSYSGNSTYGYSMTMNASDIESISKATGLAYNGIYKMTTAMNLSNHFADETKESMLYSSTLKGVIEMDASELTTSGLELAYGKYPTAMDEVAITKYAFETFQFYGYQTKVGDETVKYTKDDLQNGQSFLAKNPTFRIANKESSENYYKIVGIIDTHFDKAHFAQLDTSNTSEVMSNPMILFLMQELQNTVESSYHGQLYAAKGFMSANYKKAEDQIGLKISGSISYYSKKRTNGSSQGEDYQTLYASRALKLLDLENNSIQHKFFTSYNASTLQQRDFMIDMLAYRRWLRMYYSKTGSDESTWTDAPEWIKKDAYNTKIDDVRDAFYAQLKTKAEAPESGFPGYGHWEGYENWVLDDSSLWTDEQKIADIAEYVRQYSNYMSGAFPNWVTTEEGVQIKSSWDIDNVLSNKAYYLVLADAYMSISNAGSELKTTLYRDFSVNSLNIYEYNYDDEVYTGVLAGVFLLPYDAETNYNPENYYGSDATITIDDLSYSYFEAAKEGDYVYAITNMDTSKLKSIVQWSYDNAKKFSSETTFRYRLVSGPTTLIDSVNNILEEMSKIFLYVGLGLALFAALLMTNYIATTISYKKREIGILRAVGARSVDVFGIFLNESLIIAFINFVLASVATFGFVYYINDALRNKYNLTLTILNFGIRQVGLILLIAVGVAALASALPVFNISRKKPIDAIRSE